MKRGRRVQRGKRLADFESVVRAKYQRHKPGCPFYLYFRRPFGITNFIIAKKEEI